jgi:hypothetical protein
VATSKTSCVRVKFFYNFVYVNLKLKVKKRQRKKKKKNAERKGEGNPIKAEKAWLFERFLGLENEPQEASFGTKRCLCLLDPGTPPQVTSPG